MKVFRLYIGRLLLSKYYTVRRRHIELVNMDDAHFSCIARRRTECQPPILSVVPLPAPITCSSLMNDKSGYST